MKHEQVVPDYWTMVRTSVTFLCLAFSGLVLIRLVHAIFWFPKMMKNTEDLLNKRLKEYEVRIEEDKALEGEKQAICEGSPEKETKEPEPEVKKEK